LQATSKARCRSAVPSLVAALTDVRARPYVADALGALGDDRARRPLLDLLVAEPYVTTRPHEARALLALGASDFTADSPEAHAKLRLPAGPAKLVVLLSDSAASLDVTVDGLALTAPPDAPAASSEAGAPTQAPDGEVRSFALERRPQPAGEGGSGRARDRPTSAPLRLDLHASRGAVLALWVVGAARLD
jgi:hypothetical protein